MVAEGGATVGAHTYGDPTVPVWHSDVGRLGGDLHIGKYCSISEGVVILTGGNHRTDWITTSPIRELWHLPGEYLSGHPASKGDVRIGNDVWIGWEALILSGVTIGDGAVIGARAVVAKDVPPYAIVAGNPARVVSHRVREDQVAALRQVAWWDWSDEMVLAELPLLLSDRIDDFIARHAAPAPEATT